MAARTVPINLSFTDLPQVKELIAELSDALAKVAKIRDDLNETLHDDEVVDPIGYLETLLIRLNEALPPVE